MRLAILSALMLILINGCKMTEQNIIPEWRGKAPGTAYLGDDVLWRPREWLIFNMFDEQGTGFNLRFTVRDMNTYVHAPAPVLFKVVAPNGEIVAGDFLEDDGITGGNFQHQDGIYDPFADFRYRQWHRANSPGGMPAGKTRSPYLDHPETLPFRTVELSVPAVGKGLYRVLVVGRWDHWISMTPDRPIMTGIHPGAGPLYVHGNTLKKSFFYVPDTAGDIGVASTEEVLPYNWTMTLKDSSEKMLDSAKAQGFCTYLALTPEKKQVYELDLSGSGNGVCLHGKGFPFVMCPDAATAERIHGGIEVDQKNRGTFYSCIRELNNWSDSLTAKDLDVNVKLTPEQQKLELQGTHNIGTFKVKLGDVAKIIAGQNIDPKSLEFGKVGPIIRGVDNVDCLALAAGSNVPENPYYANPALQRRVLLANIENFRNFDPTFRFEGLDAKYTKPENPDNFFQLPTRSNWYNLGLDSRFVNSFLLMGDVVDKGIPENIIKAYQQAFKLWAVGKINMQVGEVANQWGWNYVQVMQIAKLLKDKELEQAVRRNAEIVSTPNLFGRLNPDQTPYDRNIGKLDTDCGATASGYMPEQMGFDGEYSCEQTMLWGNVWKYTQQQCIVDWFNRFNTLKTYLTLSRNEKTPQTSFSETCSPTDLNFRTRYMTHKNHQPTEMVGRVEYLDLWFPEKGKQPAKQWPCQQKEAFTKIIDNKYFFINTPAYYAILYGGPRLPLWANWSEASFNGNSVNFDGYSGPGYGGWGMLANKPGGISAIYVKDSGPVSLGQNHTVMDTNTVWGKADKPLFRKWRKEDVDPTEFAACYAQPEVKFDPKTKQYSMVELIPFVPLAVERVFTFEDRLIKVQVEIKALVDFDCRELNYSLPYFATGHQVMAINGTNKQEIPISILTTPSRPRYPDAELEKKRLDGKTFKAESLAVMDAKGKGAEFVFEKAEEFRILQPIQYRKECPGAGAFLMSLPTKFKKGQIVKFNYQIAVK